MRIYSASLIAEIAKAPEVVESDTELVMAIREGQNPDAALKLFQKHYKMVLKVINDCTRRKWYSDDCVQAGAVGLYEAAKRYDPSLGYKFLTYAVPWVRKYVLVEVCNETLPAGGVKFTNSYKDRLYRFLGYSLTGMTIPDIKGRMGLSDGELTSLQRSAYYFSEVDSLSREQGTAEEEGKVIDPPSCINVEQDMIDRESYSSTMRVLDEFLESLPVETVRILRNELELDSEKIPPRVLAKELGVSVSALCDKRCEAFRILRDYLQERKDKGED